MEEQGKWLLEMESTPSEDAVKIVETATKPLEYYVNLVDKTVAEFGRIDSKLEMMGSIFSNKIFFD